jgi:hypothetical protein
MIYNYSEELATEIRQYNQNRDRVREGVGCRTVFADAQELTAPCQRLRWN